MINNSKNNSKNDIVKEITVMQNLEIFFQRNIIYHIFMFLDKWREKFYGQIKHIISINFILLWVATKNLYNIIDYNQNKIKISFN